MRIKRAAPCRRLLGLEKQGGAQFNEPLAMQQRQQAKQEEAAPLPGGPWQCSLCRQHNDDAETCTSCGRPVAQSPPY